MLGIVVDENFYTNGVNVFDYLDANKKKTIHIKYETAIGTEWKYKIVNYVGTVVKDKGKSMEFNAYIVEFSMAKYAIFVVNSVADKLTFSSTFKDDDNKLNFEYKVKAALSHEEQNVQTDCRDIIYSKDKSKRALIIQKDNYYRIFVENIKFESNQDLYYRDCISFPFWFWERDDTYTSFVDTLENAIKNAKEYLK